MSHSNEDALRFAGSCDHATQIVCAARVSAHDPMYGTTRAGLVSVLTFPSMHFVSDLSWKTSTSRCIVASLLPPLNEMAFFPSVLSFLADDF